MILLEVVALTPYAPQRVDRALRLHGARTDATQSPAATVPGYSKNDDSRRGATSATVLNDSLRPSLDGGHALEV